MSERMIELQRAKLGLPPINMANSTSTTAGASTMPASRAAMPAHATAGGGHGRQTPQQAAATALRTEELLLQKFLQRLQRRDDSHPVATSGPTVPTALSRRMLQRQGVGYLDDTVAALASASADRFLATVLQQAKVCRTQRLKGAEMAREAARQRSRHMHQYKTDADDRRRRKLKKEEDREASNLAAIAAAEKLKKTPAAKDPDSAKSKKKKKTPEPNEVPANGNKDKAKVEDDEQSFDSMDEEEEYYQEFYQDEDEDEDDKDEDDETLLLRDLARPLEAWGFHLTGKVGLEADVKTDTKLSKEAEAVEADSMSEELILNEENRQSGVEPAKEAASEVSESRVSTDAGGSLAGRRSTTPGPQGTPSSQKL